MTKFKRVLSPLLHATSYVGLPHRGKPCREDGKLWLWAPDYGYSFCVEEIDDVFKPLPAGQCVRLEVGAVPFINSVPYRVNDACGISKLADQMLLAAFGATDFAHLETIIGEEFFDRFCVTIPDFENGYPEEVAIHYRVVLV